MSSEDMHEIDSPLESPIASPTPVDNHKCSTCVEKIKQPTLLSCLHVFCMECLKKQVEEKSAVEKECTAIECATCHYQTPMPAKGLSGLTPEYVLVDLMEMSDIEDMQIICTSCKAKEKAVARCQDCANFLCPNCVTAHQFMRCFENHKVISFDDMKKGEPSAVHRPIFCESHPSENLKNYCKTCEVPICNDCIVSDHKPPHHQPERVQDLEESEREYLNSLITECKNKMDGCEDISSSLMSSLTELQSQRDNAKDLINETFQSYKAILEKIKGDLLTELDSLQSSKELSLMDMCHDFEKAVEKLQDGCQFTEHILNNGSGLQLLLLKKLISSRLKSLVSSVPSPEVNITIEFKTDADAFKESVKKSFGSFKKDEEKLPERPSSSLHSSFENEGFMPSSILSPDSSILPPLQSDFMNMPPVSLSNPIGEIGFRSLAGQMPFNRSKSTIEGRSLSRNSHSPAMSDSGISVDAGSTNSSSSAPLVNIAALAKMGTVGYSAQGMGGCTGISDLMSTAPENSQVTFNGQVLPGLNMSNITGMPPVSSRGQTPVSDSGLSSGQRPQTPNLETLAGLLNQNSTSMLDGPNMGALGSFGLGSSSTVGTISSGQGGFGIGSSSSDSMSPTPGAFTFGSSGTGVNAPSASGTLTPTFSSGGGLSDSSNSLNTIGSGLSDAYKNSGSAMPIRRSNKMSAMQIRCKFGQLGPGKGQFNSPHGFCLGIDEDIVVADTNNHRIEIFEKTGEFKYQFGIPGREEGQLWYPRKVAVMRSSGKFVVCDRGNERSRMQIFTRFGHFVRKIAIRYIDIVAGLAITVQGHIAAVDSVSPTVFVIAEGGDLIKWFDCSDYMREPSDIAISGKEFFVCDFKGHCVVVFNEDGFFQRRIGCEMITNYPNGIDISDAGDVLVGDSHGNRFHVAVFQRDGSLIGEFECPYVKVSRCCGLKITSEGYVVTLAKNNHHVLVLNTLYIS